MTQLELFEENNLDETITPADFFQAETDGYFCTLPDLSGLYELSVDAFFAALFARMSCLPIAAELSRFIEKVKKAGNRAASDRIAGDMGDPDVFAVTKAAGKVQKEIHRLTGLLRFEPDSAGMYTARCSPDHFTLPALAEHFTIRFGEIPWVIIDEKRGICLSRQDDRPAKLVKQTPVPALGLPAEKNSSWEELWRLYHQSVSNDARKNLRLQRQFIPERYQKYLPEMRSL